MAGKSCKSVSIVAKFKWSQEIVGNLIESLNEFKLGMEYNNFYFNADKQRQYEKVRRSLYRYFDHPDFFGRDRHASTDEENKLQVKTGDKRVMEKIKELRQKLPHAVTLAEPLQYGRESSNTFSFA